MTDNRLDAILNRLASPVQGEQLAAAEAVRRLCERRRILPAELIRTGTSDAALADEVHAMEATIARLQIEKAQAEAQRTTTRERLLGMALLFALIVLAGMIGFEFGAS